MLFIRLFFKIIVHFVWQCIANVRYCNPFQTASSGTTLFPVRIHCVRGGSYVFQKMQNPHDADSAAGSHRRYHGRKLLPCMGGRKVSGCVLFYEQTGGICTDWCICHVCGKPHFTDQAA